MTKFIIAFMLISGTVCAETKTVYGPTGPIMRQSVEGDRTVQRAMDGTMLGYWRMEGGALVHRAPDGTLLERVR